MSLDEVQEQMQEEEMEEMRESRGVQAEHSNWKCGRREARAAAEGGAQLQR